MKVIKFDNFPVFASNAYLLINNDHVLLIDPGYLSKEMIIEINKYSFFDGVVLTHRHFDHIWGLLDVLRLYKDVNIYCYGNEPFFEDSRLNCSFFASPTHQFKEEIDYISLVEGFIKIGDFSLNIIYTPGHTSDSICIEVVNQNIIFTGDTLFRDCIGRCDLPSASYKKMNQSLIKLKSLLMNKQYMIYPGHDKEIDSNTLFKINPYIK